MSNFFLYIEIQENDASIASETISDFFHNKPNFERNCAHKVGEYPRVVAKYDIPKRVFDETMANLSAVLRNFVKHKIPYRVLIRHRDTELLGEGFYFGRNGNPKKYVWSVLSDYSAPIPKSKGHTLMWDKQYKNKLIARTKSLLSREL